LSVLTGSTAPFRATESRLEPVKYLRPDRQIMREPAAHTVVLQMGMDAVGKFLILGAATNEAGVELDRLAWHGRYSINLSGKPTPRRKESDSNPEI
jgi:hypothetical protein